MLRPYQALMNPEVYEGDLAGIVLAEVELEREHQRIR